MTIKYLDTKRIRGSSKLYADSLGGSGNVTNSGADLLTSGQKLGSGCLDFTGSPDYVNMSPLIAHNVMTTTGTIAFWVKFDGVENGKTLWSFSDSNGTDSHLYMEMESDLPNTKFLVQLNVSGTAQWACRMATGLLAVDTWYHFAVTQDGTSVKVYLDGVDRTIQSVTTDTTKWITDLNGADAWNLGRLNHNNNTSSSSYPDMKIDDFAIWNTALPVGNIDGTTAGSINYLRNGGTGRLATTIPTGLRVYYNCDSATITNNASGSEKDTLLAGGGWTTVGTLTTVTDGWANSGGAGNNADHRIYKNTGITVSNTAWVCDFEFYYSGTALESGLPIGFYSATGIPMSATQDMIGCQFGNGGDLNIVYKDGASSMSGTSAQSISASTTYYCRLTRTSGTEATLKIYTTESDRTNGTSQHGSTVTQSSLPSTVIGLDYVQHSSTNNGGTGTGQSTWKLTNVKFYNAMTSVSGTPAYETEFVAMLPENTLFEETDTYKTHWLQDNIWKSGIGSTFTMTDSDQGWEEGQSAAAYDTSNHYMPYSFNTEGLIYIDLGLGVINDTKFRLRFKLHASSHGNYAGGNGTYGYWGLVDSRITAVTDSGASDPPVANSGASGFNFVGFTWGVNSFGGAGSPNQLGWSYCTDTMFGSSTGAKWGNGFNSVFTWYCQAERTSATEIIFSMYNNANYTGTPSYTITKTVTSAECINLEYFCIAQSNASGNLAGYIDDIEVQNGWV